MRSAAATMIDAVVAAAETLGVPRAAMLAAAGLRERDLQAPGIRVAYDRCVALWDRIERAVGDPLVAVRLARAMPAVGHAALFQYITRAAPTIELAWQRVAPLIGLMFGEGYEVVTRRADACWELGYRLPVHGDPPIPRSEETMVASFVELCRSAAPTFSPRAVCFQHRGGAPAAAWRRALGCEAIYGASFYGLRVTPAALRADIPAHDPGLATLLSGLAQPLVAALQAGQALGSEVAEEAFEDAAERIVGYMALGTDVLQRTIDQGHRQKAIPTVRPAYIDLSHAEALPQVLDQAVKLEHLAVPQRRCQVAVEL